MLKRYYTLQEAADHLTKETGEPISIPDLLELVGDGKVRLCAPYSGSVCAFWEELFGGRVYWAAVEPYYVRGYFCLSGSARSDGEYDSRVGRSTISFNFVPTEPVEIKDFEFSDGDAEKGYREAMAKFASKEPAPASLKSAAELKGEELPESEYKYFETVVYFGGFIDGTGYPKPDYAKISIDACLIPKDDLYALLEGHGIEPEIPALLDAQLDKRGVSLGTLKLYAWPLSDGRGNKIKDGDEKLVNALRRSDWLKRAVVCKDPLTVNPALLAFALQDKSKSKQTGFFIPAKQLGNHLSESFPEYFDEYEQLISYENEL